jgi:hypothetical protein
MSTKVFKIAQGAGDILASLPYMQALGGGFIYIIKDIQTVPNWHPINQGGAEMLVPFIKSQGMDAKVITWTDLCMYQFDIDMDARVHNGWPGKCGDLLTWNSLFYGVYPDMTKPFFEIEDVPKEDFILVTRTARYHNLGIDYSYLNEINVPKRFLGTFDEFRIFKDSFKLNDLVHHPIKDYYEAAKLIKSCRFYVSNQTSHCILAEGLAVPRVLEICPAFPSVVPKTPNGRPVIYQRYFIQAINEMMELTKVTG